MAIPAGSKFDFPESDGLDAFGFSEGMGFTGVPCPVCGTGRTFHIHGGSENGRRYDAFDCSNPTNNPKCGSFRVWS